MFLRQPAGLLMRKELLTVLEEDAVKTIKQERR